MRQGVAVLSAVIGVTAACLTMPVAGAPASPVGASPPSHSGMKPGSWEITTQITSTDTASRRTITSRLCYEPDDVAVAARVLPPQRGLGAQCLASDIRRAADGVAWKLSCKGKGAGSLDGHATMTPGPTSYTAQATLTRKAGGKSVTVQEQISGRWVGACT